jgi:hypothetical protein
MAICLFEARLVGGPRLRSASLLKKCVADLRNICYTFCYAELQPVGRAEEQSRNEIESNARLRFSNG